MFLDVLLLVWLGLIWSVESGLFLCLWLCWLVPENVLLSHSQPTKKFDIKRAPWQLKVMIMTEMCRKSFDLWGLIRNQRMIYCYWQYATQLSLLGNPISFLVNLPSASPVEFLPTKSCTFWTNQSILTKQSEQKTRTGFHQGENIELMFQNSRCMALFVPNCEKWKSVKHQGQAKCWWRSWTNKHG